MKRTKILGVSLALFLSLLPLSACQNKGMGVEKPSLSQTVPLEPSAPSEPFVPEAPAEPSAPSEPFVPDPPLEPSAPETEERPAARSAQYIRVLTDGLNVRSGPGVNYPSLGHADRGNLLGFSKKEGGWYQTRYRGQTAYVSANEQYSETVTLAEGSERTEQIIRAGLEVLGTPYVYGAVRLHDGKGNMLSGFTPAAFDCSSLMQYMFYKGAGQLIDVTTRTQIKQGTGVGREEIARGDLLFFTNASRCNKTGIERVGHVALYLGENYILHTASDFAKIEQITPQRQTYFLEARRV